MKSLNDKIYSDRQIKCRCGFLIGETRLDGQCLIFKSGLIVFNYISFQCPNNHNSSWLAPLLPNETPTLDNTAPDSKQIERRAAMTAKRHRTIQKRADYGLKKSGEKHVVQIGGEYFGIYETADEAKAVRDVELAKQFPGNNCEA